ncbi:MAG: MFS transporter [Thermodesulfobacteriota bacterium]
MAIGIFYGWWVVTACFIIGLYVAGAVYFGFSAFFEPLVKEFGWSYTQVSLATSLRGLEMGIFAPIVGFLVDRFGSRKLVLLGTIIVGFSLILLSLTRSLLMFYVSFLLLAFGAGGCTSVVLLTAVAKWFDKNLGMALGVVTCGYGTGGLIIPLIVRLIDLYHWRTSLVILGLGMWALGIPLSFIIRDKPKQDPLPVRREPPHHTRDQTKNKVKEFQIDLRDALKQKTFFYLVIVEVIRLTIVSAVVLHVMPYLSTRGIPRSTAGVVTAAVHVFSIFGRFGFGWLGDVYNKKHMTLVALCSMAMGLLAFCWIRQGWMILLFLLLFSPGCWGTMILMRTMQREYFGKDSFGKMIGIIMGIGSIGGIIGPTIAGWVFDLFRSYHFVWLGFFGFNLIAIILILGIEPKRNR